MKVLVIGRGESGRAAGELAASRGDEVEYADDVGLVVASPGVKVVSELEYGVRALAKRGVRMLAVTGSKGKSSVVKLVADALSLDGKKAVPCGNYGLPVSAVGDCEWAVVEVSSFQLETTNLGSDAFEAAVVLNLQEDHLDRHGGAEAYHAVKRRLLSMAKESADFSLASAPREDVSGLARGSYFDNPVLSGNAMAAVWLMRRAGLSDAAMRRAFENFSPLPHRMECVGTFGGVRWIDDSKATSLAALAAGVEMAGPGTRLIAGGRAKGDAPENFTGGLTKRVKKVYLIGECAEVFFSAWSRDVDCEICGTMEKAVGKAAREAAKGETVLLSPGAASYDQFKDFGERGEVFAALAKKEGQKNNE